MFFEGSCLKAVKIFYRLSETDTSTGPLDGGKYRLLESEGRFLFFLVHYRSGGRTLNFVVFLIVINLVTFFTAPFQPLGSGMVPSLQSFSGFKCFNSSWHCVSLKLSSAFSDTLFPGLSPTPIATLSGLFPLTFLCILPLKCKCSVRFCCWPSCLAFHQCFFFFSLFVTVAPEI